MVWIDGRLIKVAAIPSQGFKNLTGFVLKKVQIYPKQEVVTVNEIRQAVIAGENEDAVGT
jgi:hypothetical protein